MFQPASPAVRFEKCKRLGTRMLPGGSEAWSPRLQLPLVCRWFPTWVERWAAVRISEGDALVGGRGAGVGERKKRKDAFVRRGVLWFVCSSSTLTERSFS
jgi:hypothetical protein